MKEYKDRVNKLKRYVELQFGNFVLQKDKILMFYKDRYGIYNIGGRNMKFEVSEA